MSVNEHDTEKGDEIAKSDAVKEKDEKSKTSQESKEDDDETILVEKSDVD